MRNKKSGVIWLTVLFLAVAVVFGRAQYGSRPPFSFTLETREGAEEIRFWRQSEEQLLVFLPGHGELSKLRLNAQKEVLFDEISLSDGMSCEGLQLDRPYRLNGGPKTITLLRSENLPSLHLYTASGTLDYVHAKLGNQESGAIRLYRADGTLDYQGSILSVKMRGNNTEFMEKKPYALELLAPGDLLGMGQAKNWVLQSNALDDSNLRNKIVFDFASDLALPYTPDSEWVELYLNGEYAGLYLLGEKNEVHPHRVDLTGSGSFLVSMDFEERALEKGKPFITTELGASLIIRHSNVAQEELAQTFQAFEEALCAVDGRNPATGQHWTELIDLDSWKKKYLIEEVFGNVDGGAVSQYFYRSDSGGKIMAGPVWDYDMAMANPWLYMEGTDRDYYDLIPTAHYVHCPPEYRGSPWYSRLYREERFFEEMVRCYRQDFLPRLDALIDTGIPGYEAQIGRAAQMNQLRWNTWDALEEMEKLRTYLSERRDFLNALWLDRREPLQVVSQFLARVTTYGVFPGDPLPDLPPLEGFHWVNAETGEPVDPSMKVWTDLHIELRRQAAEKE